MKHLQDLADVFGKKDKRKPEALLPLDEGASGLRVLILFDGEKEGGPMTIEIPARSCLSLMRNAPKTAAQSK